MGILDIFRRQAEAVQLPEVAKSSSLDTTLQSVSAMSEAAQFFGFNDPRFKEWMKNGGGDISTEVSVDDAMRNTAVHRCVSLISYSIGMLPLHLIDAETKEKVRDHPLFAVLHRRPNNWQTAFNFRQYMQRNALIYGNAYALIIRSMDRVVRLIPLNPRLVTVRQKTDWSVEYCYQKSAGSTHIIDPKDMLHVYADSDNGLSGTSIVKVAAKAIELARELETSQTSFFKNGMQLGGMFGLPDKLSPEAYACLKASMAEFYSGSKNAGKWLIGEEGMQPHQFRSSAKDSQQIESRGLQIDEIGRAFGVPRPFLGVDDTSWGTGVDVLGQMFVRYGLNAWFTAWEQAVERSCINEQEQQILEAKFNAGALLRGSMKDQAEFFAKALGSGGHQPWMTYGEVRDMSDMPEQTIAPNPLIQKGNGHEPKNAS